MTEGEALKRVQRHQIFAVCYMLAGVATLFVALATHEDIQFIATVATVMFGHGMVERRWRAREVYAIFHGRTMNPDDFK